METDFQSLKKVGKRPHGQSYVMEMKHIFIISKILQQKTANLLLTHKNHYNQVIKNYFDKSVASTALL